MGAVLPKLERAKGGEREWEMVEEESLVEAALRVLNTEDPIQKARLGDQVATHWLQGLIPQPYHPSDQDLPVPDRPARLTNVSNFIHIFLNHMAYQLFDKMTQRVCICLFAGKVSGTRSYA